jgi:hypothetical protein
MIGYSRASEPAVNVKNSFTATALTLGSRASIFCEKDAND